MYGRESIVFTIAICHFVETPDHWRVSVVVIRVLVFRMATESKKAVKKPKGKAPTPEECYTTFQGLRNEQKNIINKLSEVELDLSEHK